MTRRIALLERQPLMDQAEEKREYSTFRELLVLGHYETERGRARL